MRDALLKRGVAGHRQMQGSRCSLKEEVHFAHWLLLQCFVGRRDELFEKILDLLIQPRLPIAAGTPLWEETKIAIAVGDLALAKLLVPSLEAPL